MVVTNHIKRRTVLKKSGSIAGAVGLVALGSTPGEATSKTTFEIEEFYGTRVDYTVWINESTLDDCGDGSQNESNDDITTYSDSAKVEGTVRGGKDCFEMPSTAEVVEITVVNKGDDSANVNLDVGSNLDSTQSGTIVTTTENGGGKGYSFCVGEPYNSGSVSMTSYNEGNDSVFDDGNCGSEDCCADGTFVFESENEDRWDVDGQLRKFGVEFGAGEDTTLEYWD